MRQNHLNYSHQDSDLWKWDCVYVMWIMLSHDNTDFKAYKSLVQEHDITKIVDWEALDPLYLS